MDKDNIQIRADFTQISDESLAILDAIGNGSLPLDSSTTRQLAQGIACNARLSRQIVSWIVRLNSVGTFVVS